MVKNKIVKFLTQGLIFSLCCILIVGAVYLPTYASEVDDGLYFWIQNNSYVTDGYVQYEGTDGYKFLKFGERVDVSTVYSPFDSRDYTNVFRVDITLKSGSVWGVVSETYDTEVALALYDSAESMFIDLSQWDTLYGDIGIVIAGGTDSTTNVICSCFIKVTPQTPSDTDQDIYDSGYQQGYFDGSLDGFNDGYEAGYQDGYNEGSQTNGFFKLLTDPITAIFSMQIAPDITVGAVWLTLIGIALFLAFLKLYSGG